MATPISLSNRHHAILDYLLQNPGVRQGVVARHFGVSQSWISTLINSDLFQAEWRRRRAALEVVQDHHITQKLAAVAGKGLEAMEATLDAEEKPAPRDLSEMTRTALQGLGYLGKGQSPGSVVQNNTVNLNGQVSHDELREAREIFERATRALPSPV